MEVTSGRSYVLKYLKGITFSTLWYGSILLGFFALYCPVLPLLIFNRKLFRKATECIFFIWESFAVALMEVIFGVKFRVCGDTIRASETSIFLVNHRNRLDWNFFWGALAHGTLPPAHNCKIVLKSAIKHFPGLGWIMQMTCFLYLKRNWNEDREVISKTIQYFRDIKLNFQILLFPEGTNLSDDTKRKSDQFAMKSGLPKYDYVIHPRTTGFTYLAEQMMKGNILEAVYDITVMYPKTLPVTELDLIKGNIPEEVHFLIKRYPVNTLPNTEDELKNWILRLWENKENSLKAAYAKGHFDDSKYSVRPVNASYLSVLFWFQLMAGMIYLMLNYTYVQIWCFLHSLFFIIISAFTDGLQNIEMDLHGHSLKKIS